MQARKHMLLGFCTFFCIIILLCGGFDHIFKRTMNEEKKCLEDAIWRGITQCYAIEGRYPQNLNYLKEHYQISYDTDDFFVDYQVLGENILPEVTIIEKARD